MGSQLNLVDKEALLDVIAKVRQDNEETDW
jgi:hypothetical protein